METPGSPLPSVLRMVDNGKTPSVLRTVAICPTDHRWALTDCALAQTVGLVADLGLLGGLLLNHSLAGLCNLLLGLLGLGGDGDVQFCNLLLGLLLGLLLRSWVAVTLHRAKAAAVLAAAMGSTAHWPLWWTIPR